MSKYTYEEALAQVRAILDGHMSPDNDGKEPSMPKLDLGADQLARVLFNTGAEMNRQTLDRIQRAYYKSALEECLEYFQEHYDVRDGESGPTANREMELGMMIEEALGRRP